MAVSKVILNGDTLMDVTQDTVESDNLLYGETATRNDGVSITGTVVTASPYDSNPAMDGTASAGSSTAYSRGDHVHPSDTSKITNPTTKSADQVLTYNGTSWIAADPSEEVFIATYNTTTYAEITAAYTAGKLIVCKYGYKYVPLTMLQSSNYYFHYPRNDGNSWYRVSNENIWSQNDYSYVPSSRTINSKVLSSNITLTASDVGALPDSTVIPTATSDLTNDSGFITAAQAPVQSVNGQTGAVTITDSDEKVKADPLNGLNSGRGLLFASNIGNLTATSTVGTSNKIIWNDYSQELSVYNSDVSKRSMLKYDMVLLKNSSHNYESYIRSGSSLTANRTYTLPDKTGTVALTSDIPTISYPVTSVNTKTGAVVLDVDDVGAQSQITANGILKGDGAGGVTAATAGTDYMTPANVSGSYVPKTITQNGGTTSWSNTHSLYTETLEITSSKAGSDDAKITMLANDVQGNPQGGTYVNIRAKSQSTTNTLSITPSATTIHNVVTPTADGDAANKKYVDDSISGIVFPDQIYYVDILGTVTWSEVVAAYNAGKLIVGYYDYEQGTRGYLNLVEIHIESSSGSSSLDRLSFSAVTDTGSTTQTVCARWSGSNIGWSYTDYTLATQTYVSDSITAAIGTAIAASY